MLAAVVAAATARTARLALHHPRQRPSTSATTTWRRPWYRRDATIHRTTVCIHFTPLTVAIFSGYLHFFSPLHQCCFHSSIPLSQFIYYKTVLFVDEIFHVTYRGKNVLFNFPMYKSHSKNLLIFCSFSFLNFLIRMRTSYFYYFSYLRETYLNPLSGKDELTRRSSLPIF